MATQEDLRKAVKLYKDRKMGGTVQMKNQWLMNEKGFTFQECLEAMNMATNGEVLRSAGIE